MTLIYFKNKINFSSCYIKIHIFVRSERSFYVITKRKLQFALDKPLQIKRALHKYLYEKKKLIVFDVSASFNMII